MKRPSAISSRTAWRRQCRLPGRFPSPAESRLMTTPSVGQCSTAATHRTNQAWSTPLGAAVLRQLRLGSLSFGRCARRRNAGAPWSGLLALIRERRKFAGIAHRFDRFDRLAPCPFAARDRLGRKLLILFDRHQLASLVPVDVGAALRAAFLHPEAGSARLHAVMESVQGGRLGRVWSGAV